MREAGHGIEISLPFQLLFFFLYLHMIMQFLLNKSRKLKFHILWQLSHFVSRSLRNFGSQLHIVVRKAKLKEIIIVNVAIHVLVESQEQGIHIRLFNVVDMILAEEPA